jgi:hypothetical protein
MFAAAFDNGWEGQSQGQKSDCPNGGLDEVTKVCGVPVSTPSRASLVRPNDPVPRVASVSQGEQLRFTSTCEVRIAGAGRVRQPCETPAKYPNSSRKAGQMRNDD